MRINDLQKKILTSIKAKLVHKDLCSLCTFSEIPSTGIKKTIIDRLEIYVHNQPYNRLLLLSNKIDEYLNTGKKITVPVQVQPESGKWDNNLSNFNPDTLNDELLSKAPINFTEELTMIDRKAIVVVQFTTYATTHTSVPTQTIVGMNDRASSVRIPNMLLYVPVQISPFYCCAICLHPLSLLMPQTMPNLPQNGRNTSRTTVNFSLSDDTCKLIARNCQKIAGNKLDFRWQVLLRFVAIDPTESIPSPGQSVAQMIPPYLTVNLNNEVVPLWDVIASNCRAKEGKRHPKAVNISDKLNVTNRGPSGYRQNLTFSWWQTPGVFQYYYVGVYLERKLAVREILDLFTSNRHINVLPIDATLALIKSKLTRNSSNDDDDDLVASSMLPISLSCPVGRSRIEIPIRSLNCQHLQCFDAHLFLSMNERRSIWKCPVCEASATPNELFCDKYFQEILQEFKDSDDVNDINVSSDGSHVPVLRRQNEDKNHHDPESQTATTTVNIDDTMIVLDDSDDESDKTHSSANKAKAVTPQKLTLASNKNKEKPAQPTSLNHATSNAKSNEPLISKPADQIASKSSVTVGPSAIRITAPLGNSSRINPSPLPSISLASNHSSLTLPPPSFTIDSVNTTRSVIQAPTQFTPPHNRSLFPHQSQFKVSSLLQSPIVAPIHVPLLPTNAGPIKATLESPIVAPIQAPTLPHIQASLSSSIQASSGTPLASQSQAQITPIVAQTKPTRNFNQVQALINASINDAAPDPAPMPLPIAAPLYESFMKINPPKPNHEPIQALFNCISAPTADIARSHDDVIKSLATEVICAPDLSINKNPNTLPITCPLILSDKRTTTNDEVTETRKATESIQESQVQPTEPVSTPATKRETMKRTRLPFPKPVTGGVNIPTVSIDLTEDDDEEPSIVNGNYQTTKVKMDNSNTKWCNMNDTAFRNSYRHNPNLPNKFSSVGNRGQPMARHNNSISHYNTRRVETAPRSNKPIDLTGDDDDDDDDDNNDNNNDNEEEGGNNNAADDDMLGPRTNKRQKMATMEDGQVEDSDELSPSSPSSSESESSSEDLKRQTIQFPGQSATPMYNN